MPLRDYEDEVTEPAKTRAPRPASQRRKWALILLCALTLGIIFLVLKVQ